jgi:hypothetical protein
VIRELVDAQLAQRAAGVDRVLPAVLAYLEEDMAPAAVSRA